MHSQSQQRNHMTTAKQAAANKQNAKSSTGPKTAEGKQVVAMNAISHGILSQRLFLGGENPSEFAGLQDELRQALKPVGILELALVEKIAVALWKQRRMVAAETASIELGRRLDRKTIKESIAKAMGQYLAEAVDLEPADPEQVAWCEAVVAEYNALDQAVLTTNNLEAMAKQAPLMFGQFKDEAEEEELELVAYLGYMDNGLAGWAGELSSWCNKQIATLAKRPMVQAVAELVQAQASAPITHELMARYQVALDGELYRAMEALRKQQEWRLKAGIEVDGEPVAA